MGAHVRRQGAQQALAPGIPYLYMDDSIGTCKYVLVLNNSLTPFWELETCESPTSAVAACAVLDCWKRFGPGLRSRQLLRAK